MSVELRIPEAAESITEVMIAEWLKAEGDRVERDEPVVELETDKASMELPAPAAGVIGKILKKKGEIAAPGDVIAYIEESIAAEKPAAPKLKPEPVRAASRTSTQAEPRVMPAAQRALAREGLQPGAVAGTGPGGRILKEDVLRQAPPTSERIKAAASPAATDGRQEEVVPMSMLRRRVAQRLVEAQHTAALLTTFNEIDMSAVIELRRDFQQPFQDKYGIKLGFMSFFVKASIEALKTVPEVNAEVRGTDIIYRNYYDISVAVAGPRGLVVPVLRNAERMSFAEIEKAIADFAQRAKDNKLDLEELKGGTFTISNGGVFGSLLSTPIVNPPQSGVLGLHVIQDRPVARQGQVVIRPMMYVALTYDHRIVDGREGVNFLKRIKEVIETPARMLVEI